MGDLYPFQVDGVRHLTENHRAYLADDMGLGKTVQAASAAREVGARNVLVVCPASAEPNWHREWRQWGPDGLFATVSYAKLARGLGAVQGQDWDLVILDEAHYCKTPTAKRTRAALAVARAAPRAWLLSGTPMPNHPGELYAPVRALWPEVTEELGLTSYDRWFNHFCRWTPTQWGRRVYGIQNGGELGHILRPLMLRRRLKDVELELPPLRVDVQLLPRDRVFEETLEEQGIDPDALWDSYESEEGREDASPSRLRRLLGVYKAPRIAKLIDQELAERQYQQVVVFAYHRDVLKTLRSFLEKHGAVGFDGSTPTAKRQEAIDTFREDPSVRVFLAQQTAAGVAINLQTASEVVLVEPSWTPDENRQAIKRIQRIGQTRPCRARIFGVAGTLDEGLMRRVRDKALMQEEVGL